MSRDQVGVPALARADVADASRTYPAAAVRVPYGLASGWFGDQNPLIAADRCVWVVTIDAPFSVKHGPPGAKLPSFSRYSVVIDAASGQSIGISAGAGAPDVISGRNLVDRQAG